MSHVARKPCKVLNTFFQSCRPDVGSSETTQALLPSDPDAFSGDVDWQALVGVRMSKLKTFVQSASTRVWLTTAMLVMHPLRLLMSWQFKRCAQIRKPGVRPPLLDLVRPASSPIILVLQYFAAILGGQCTSDDWVVFRAQYEEEASQPQLRQVRKVILVAIANLHSRLERVVMGWPWKLAAVVDRRLPFSRRDAVARELMEAAECCVDAGFSARLQKMVQNNPVALLEPGRQAQLMLWASSVDFFNADCENAHARNRRTDGSCHPSSMAAEMVLQEAKLLKLVTSAGQAAAGHNATARAKAKLTKAKPKTAKKQQQDGRVGGLVPPPH